MAYNKKYIGEKEVIKTYLDGREDRIESEFDSFKDKIVEIGSNSNGDWEKWYSGKLVQRGVINLEFDITSSWGGWYYGGSQSFHSFPIGFTDEPHFYYTITSIGSVSFVPASYYITYANKYNFSGFSVVRPTSATDAIAKITWEATGRWK